MTKKLAKAILAAEFSTWSKEQRARLHWHATKGTPICCGAEWQLFSDGQGGG